MATTFPDRLRAFTSSLVYFVPAAIAFVVAAFVTHPASLAIVLVADVLTMCAVCHALRFDAEMNFVRWSLPRGAAYLILLLLYTAFVALLVGYPASMLVRDPTLSAALALSATSVIALLALWRLWPAFGLFFVPDDDARDHRTPGIFREISQRLTQAGEITGKNELFFSHGLLVALALLVLVQGALALTGVSTLLPAGMRGITFAVYALIVAPLAHLLIATRSADALIVERRRAARRTRIDDIAIEIPAVFEEPAPILQEGLGKEDLDAMLLRCVRGSQTELALAALTRGADPNAVPPASERDQRSAVELAILSPDLRLLRALIERGADLNRAQAGPPLIAATRDSYQGRPDAVMTLLTNGADPRCTDAKGNTPLHFAALAAQPVVAALLCDSGAPIDAVNRDGLTPLATACEAANWDLAWFFLERSARVDIERAQPVLIAAAGIAEDDARGVKLLLKHKANVNARDALGRTPLMVAALHGHPGIVRMLLDNGADVNVADRRGTTALMEAARSGACAVIDEIATRKPAPDLLDATGRTALIIASQSRLANEEVVSRLIALGASSDIAAPDGRRAVDFAATAGRWSVVSVLDPNYVLPACVEENASATPIPGEDSPEHLLDALRFGHWDIVEKFTERFGEWTAAAHAKMFLELSGPDGAAPRRWLLNHRLIFDAPLEDGTTLFAAALARLPAALDAACDLFAIGASPAGCNPAEPMSAANPSQRDRACELSLAMIERGCEMFAADSEGRTPLADAVAVGELKIVQALLARGVDPNFRDRHGRTALFAALSHTPDRAVPIVQELIRAGADPEVTAANGETPLGIALAHPDASAQNWLNWSIWKLPRRALRASDVPAAATAGDRDAIEKLISLGLSVHAVDHQGADALLRAAGCGHAALVQFLLDRGADPAQSAPSGATPMSAAVSARRDAVVEILLARGVSADQRLPGGGTALMIAASLGYPEIVTRLLANKASANLEDERGTRALHVAAQSAFAANDSERARRVLEILLESGADPNAANAAGQTALLLLLGARAEPGSVADQKHLLAAQRVLLKHGADINRQDQRGVSALHACALHGLLLPARALLSQGADPELRDMRERSPREIAHLLGYIDVAAEFSANSIPRASQLLQQPARTLD
jgi:uncharacterized protein